MGSVVTLRTVIFLSTSKSTSTVGTSGIHSTLAAVNIAIASFGYLGLTLLNFS